MNEQALSASFSFFTSASNAGTLSSPVPWITCAMATSFVSLATIGDFRPERMAVTMPAFCSSLKPFPSWMLNAFIASPRAANQSVPSVITPSTSKMARRTPRARCRTSSFTLDDLRGEQVVEGDGAHELAAGHHRDAPAEALLLEDLRGFRREAVGRDAGEVADHHVAHRESLHAVALLERAAQVAVGEDAQEPVVGVDDAGHADALPRHLVERRGKERIAGAVARQLVALAHDVRDMDQQAPPQRAARMVLREVVGREAARVEEGAPPRPPERPRSGGSLPGGAGEGVAV